MGTHSVKLKDIVSDLDPLATAVRDANKLVLVGKGIDVYGMVLTGIDFLTTVKDAVQVARALPMLQDTQFGAMTLQQADKAVRLATSGSSSVMAASRFLFAANVLGVLASYVNVWISLGAGWAQAKAEILTDQAMSGASRGAVLAANGAGPNYVNDHFRMTVKPSYPMYREVEGEALNVHNISLLAGYAQGKTLRPNQQGNLFKFLHARMTAGQRSIYSSEWSTWSARRKIDYYIEVAAIFRRELLRV